MSLLLRINDRDLSAYIRVAHDEGLDPAGSGYAEQQFSGAPAFSEGQVGIGEAIGNREMVVPLHLRADSSDELHVLIRDINAELARGAVVEYATDDQGASTFFDLEGGTLDVDYQFWIVRANRIRATLRLWTRPFGNTGTSRVIASVQATAAVQLPATGVLGDAAAVGALEVRVGSRVASGGRVVAYGLHRSASFNAIRGPSGPDFVAQSGATVRGASGAIGSQYLALPVSPTTASGVALTSFLDPPAGHVGRHRVLGIMRSRLDRPIAITAQDRFGARLGPTAVASVTDGTKWGVVDLGEIQVPARRSSQESVPTQYVKLRAGGASGNVINASPALEVNRLVYLPLDESPGMLRTAGAAGNSLIASDDFTPYSGSDEFVFYSQTPQGYLWKPIGGALGRSVYGVGFAGASAVGAIGEAYPAPTSNASGFYSLASGQLLSDLSIETRFQMTASPAAASPAQLEVWVKQFSASYGYAARLIPGPSHTLQLMSYTAAGASVMASAGIATTLASGLYAGQPHKLLVNAAGGGLSAWLATAPAGSPALSASHGAISAQGWPALRMANGSNVASGLLVIDDFTVYDPGAGASDMGPREWFRFEAYPERRAFQGNASAFLSDRSAAFRGVHPRVPAVGSPAGSGAAQMVVLSGDPTDFLGNDLMDVTLSVTERFRYLR